MNGVCLGIADSEQMMIQVGVGVDGVVDAGNWVLCLVIYVRLGQARSRG